MSGTPRDHHIDISRNGYNGKILLRQPYPESANSDTRGAIRARRTRLQSGLLAKVPEGVILYGKKLISAEDTGKAGVRLKFEDGSSTTADLLVGADGIRSVCFMFQRIRNHWLSRHNSRWCEKHYTQTTQFTSQVSESISY